MRTRRVQSLPIPAVCTPWPSFSQTAIGWICIFALVILVGCGTPMAVKKLSSEQVKVVASFEQTLKNYFDLIEKLTSNQVIVTDATIDDTTNQILALRKQQALNALKNATDDQARQKALDTLSSTVQSEMQSATTEKSQIDQLFGKLKAKHKEMLAAFAAIKSAQEKLDTYIQLKKADEAAFSELLSAVGFSQDTLNRDASDITNIADQIRSVIKSK
jgi:hypothetical protein